MHPMLKPALRRAWRDLQTVQFGVTPAHAVVVGPLDLATGSLLERLDGTRGLPLLREEARALGLPDGLVDRLVERLAKAGLIDDPTAGGAAADALRRRPGGLNDRLRPDLASLSVVHPEPGGGIRRLAARRAMRVQVRGAGRVGATLAAVLSASGVGRVEVLDGQCVESWDVAPGGLPARAAGKRRNEAAERLVRGAAPGRLPREAELAEPMGGSPPGLALVVVAPRDGLDAYAPDPVAAESWIASGIPHLYTGVVEGTGVVGPLVLPGGSACAKCLALGWEERDPAWPRLLAQWRSGRREGVPACDMAVATAVAGLAAAHVLAFLDGDLPASTGARWKTSLPALAWASERIGPHAGCGCGAAGNAGGECASGVVEPQDTMSG
ncbi:TOMM precursor leader peptide-binding protein [Streptomyces sannanensis]|uniref:TOMM leader peptide-binding protein n=1 Tax=Streptomyces sannanensis TaxID=285536 RepID=A0ABP6SG33_9ACTN